MNYIKSKFLFTKRILQRMSQNPVLFASFVVLSVLSALTEGLSVSLLIPILDAQSMSSSFSSIPVLGLVSSYFDDVQGTGKLTLAASFLLIVVVFRGVLQLLVQALSVAIPIEVQRGMAEEGFRGLMYASMEYINSRDIGDHLNNIKERPARISFLLKTFADMFSLLLVLIIFLYMMVLISWKMTIVSVAVLGGFSLCLKVFSSGPVTRLGARTSGVLARYNQAVYEALDGMQLIRIKCAENIIIKRFQSVLSDSLDVQRKTGIYYAIPGPAMSTAVGVFICLLIITGASIFESDPQDFTSKLILFLFLLMRLMTPVTALNNCRHAILTNMAALDECEEFLCKVKELMQKNGSKVFENFKSEIEFKNVSFNYDNNEANVIRDVSIKIKAGEMVAVIGPSGAGKSTIVGLLARLYDPQEGSIIVDGIDVRDLEVSSWRRRISIVSQDIILFNDTVENNISFGVSAVNRDDVVAAAKMAAADAFINELPEGYNTMLGDRGVRLSGGQKQRISIARALLSDPDILIMDEGTSHLDSVSEHAIQTAVEEISKKRTVLVVAHRLSTIRRANRIIVMEKGRVIEEGNHDALVAARGAYLNLLNHQQLDLIDDDRV